MTIREFIGNDITDILQDLVTDWPVIKPRIIAGLAHITDQQKKDRINVFVAKCDSAYNILKNLNLQ